MLIQPNSKLLIIGDSVTDCGREHPIGDGRMSALGNGYVSFCAGLLEATYPQHGLRVINMGTGGNTVCDLQARWQSDVLDLTPDWLVIMIGINDVWRQFDSPAQTEWHVSLADYQQILTQLIKITRPRLKGGLVLMTPYFIEPHRADPMRKMMDSYGAVVKALAAQYGAILVDTQAAFDEVLLHLHPMSLAWDRVHPTASGHFILARALLKAIGYMW